MDHLPQGPSPLTFPILRYSRDPAGYYAACERQFGALFTTPTPFGPVVVTGHPAAARVIYGAPPDAIDAFAPDMLAPFLGQESVIVLSGAEHVRARKLVMPPFHGERMRAYATTIESTARRVVGELPYGNPFRMLEVTQRIALEVMIEAVLGLSVGRQRELVADLSAAIFEHVSAMAPLIVFVPAMRRDFGGFGPWARFTRARARLDAVVYRVIRAARGRYDSGEREDILDMMIGARYEDGSGMSDVELRDQILTLLFAGHETTAIGLAWAFYHLLRNPAELEALQAEISATVPADLLAELPRLGAVCNEALRVFPVVVDVPRTLRRPMTLLGHDLPAGVAVSASPILLHAHEETFPDPTVFRPARFLERKFGPHEFAPFGGGSRRCVGAAFALYEMKVVLGTLLRENVFRRAEERPERSVRRGFVMAPERGVTLVIER